MNNQFIQRVIFDWNRIDNDSYLKGIEAFKGVEKLDFNKPITFFVGENGSGKSEFVMVDNMEWFNVFGLIFIAVIMIPNVVFAIKCKDGFDNKWNNKYVEVTEQVGRLGCFGFMIINIPGTWFGWWSDEALALSIIPSMLFLFSGIMSRSVLLIIASVLFAPSHIVISYKNVK